MKNSEPKKSIFARRMARELKEREFDQVGGAGPMTGDEFEVCKYSG